MRATGIVGILTNTNWRFMLTYDMGLLGCYYLYEIRDVDRNQHCHGVIILLDCRCYCCGVASSINFLNKDCQKFYPVSWCHPNDQVSNLEGVREC